MRGTSELGPVDPRIMLPGTRLGLFSVHNIVNTYKTLFKEAVAEQAGNLEPYLQRLQRFDVRELAEFEAAIKLSEDIAVRNLQSGMMKNVSFDGIKEKIKIFTVPDQVLSHARPIGKEEAANCDLVIEHVDVREKWWKLVHELYIRTDNYVSTFVAKCMESKSHAFYAPAPAHVPKTGDDEE